MVSTSFVPSMLRSRMKVSHHSRTRRDTARTDEAQQQLHEVTIPAVKAQEGFVRGAWLRSSDKSNGRGVLLFDTEEDAKATAAALAGQGQQSGGPVTVRNIETFEVVGEA